MLQTISLSTPWRGKTEITPTDLIKIQLESHSSYPHNAYIHDLMREFEMTNHEAAKIVARFFIKKQMK